jgi:hypothetical protein
MYRKDTGLRFKLQKAGFVIIRGSEYWVQCMVPEFWGQILNPELKPQTQISEPSSLNTQT